MEFKLVEDLRLITIPVTTCLLILITYIIFGAVLFAAWEGWNYMDGAYFCFISLMTIGFGDFVPGNNYIYNVGDNVTEQVKLIDAILMSISVSGPIYQKLTSNIDEISIRIRRQYSLRREICRFYSYILYRRPTPSWSSGPSTSSWALASYQCASI